MSNILWLASVLGVSVHQVILGLVGVSCIFGYNIAYGDKSTKESQKTNPQSTNDRVDLNIREIDLWELRRLQK